MNFFFDCLDLVFDLALDFDLDFDLEAALALDLVFRFVLDFAEVVDLVLLDLELDLDFVDLVDFFLDLLLLLVDFFDVDLFFELDLDLELCFLPGLLDLTPLLGDFDGLPISSGSLIALRWLRRKL